MDDFKTINPYALLDLPITADKSQIKKAYRKNSRKCHPDKNPDNPNAAALFNQLKKARDFLLDDSKRAELDKKLKAQEANKVRDKEWDEQRQKFKQKLEEQERLAKEHSEAELNRKREDRLRREEAQRCREEDAKYRQKLEEQRRENYSSQCRIKVTWDTEKEDPKREYNEENLKKMFSPYGEIEAIIISSKKKKKKGIALIEYSTPEATKKAQLFVTGYPSNPLKVTILESNEEKAKKQYESMIYKPTERSSQTQPLFPSSSFIKPETSQNKETYVPSKPDLFPSFSTSKSKSKKKSSKKSKYRSSDDNSSSEEEWVEKKVEKKTEEVSAPKRDDWMMDTSFVPTYSKHDKKPDKKKDEKNDSILDKLGQSDRELNPYWKDGGTGLPEESRHRKTSGHDDYFKSKDSKSFMKPREEASERNYSVYDRPSSSKSRWRKQPTSQHTEEKIVADEKDRVIEKPAEPEKSTELLSDQEMNALAAKILKAEIIGNQDLVKQLKEKLENARKARQTQSETPDVVVLTNVNSRGFVQPLRNVSKDSHGDKRQKNYETHVDGKRVRYFEDDQKYSLNEMFEREQMRTTADHNREFMELASKSKADKDYAIDDLFMEQTISNKSRKNNEMQQAIDKQKKTDKALDECYWCLTNNRIKKHLIISTSSKCYLCVPHFQSLTEGHCLIVPTYHATCATLVDEEVWQEVKDYCKTLVRMFRALDQDVVFFETAMNFKYYPHMVLHCVPIPYESGNLAPIYFKKAIQECEKEWSDNKKLVEYKKMNIRQAIPKGLPYFMVNFGTDNGFAHVIEEEKYFPKNFAQEIIGGILDLDHRIWRKQQTDDFETQCKKVNTFKEMWKTVESSDS